MTDAFIRWRVNDLKRDRQSLIVVQKLVDIMHVKLSHKAMLPINSLCSVEGTIVDTSTVMVRLGDFVVSRSTSDASRLIDAKVAVIDTLLGQLEKKSDTNHAEAVKTAKRIEDRVEEEEPFNIEENWTPEETELRAAERYTWVHF